MLHGSAADEDILHRLARYGELRAGRDSLRTGCGGRVVCDLVGNTFGAVYENTISSRGDEERHALGGTSVADAGVLVPYVKRTAVSYDASGDLAQTVDIFILA